MNLVQYQHHPVFDLEMPMSCPAMPSEILNPRTTWKDKETYDQNALILAQGFVSNFKQYKEFTDNETINANPKIFFTV